MKIEKEYLEDHQVKLIVEIDKDSFERSKRKAARQIAKRIKIPGFRPGKAPYGVILRHVGEGHVLEKGLEILIEDQYPNIIEEAEIEPYGPGSLKNVEELDPLTLEFVVPLDAEIELGDYKSIRIDFEPPETTEKDVQEALEQIREQNASRESVERPADIGDVVFLRISGIRTDIEDESEAVIVEERFSSSVIHEDESENEFPYPGFSKELIGLSAEEKKTIPYQYPDDHPDEELQGVKTEFKVVVTNIQEQILPDFDDEFAKEASDFDTIEEWKDDLRKNIKEQAKANYSEEYDNQIFEEIISDSIIKFPPQMVENEKKDILRGLEYRLSQQGISKDLYLQIRGIDEDTLEEELSPVAEDRIKRALVLYEIARQEEIEVDPQEVQAETTRTVDAISSAMTPNEAKKLSQSQYIPNLISSITADLASRTTMEFLRATAKGESWSAEAKGEEAEESKDQSLEAVTTENESIDNEDKLQSEMINKLPDERKIEENPDVIDTNNAEISETEAAAESSGSTTEDQA